MTRNVSIEYAIANPSIGNLLGLRSGRDCFSNSGLNKLKEMAFEQLEIENATISPSDKAVAYRWVLRGLPAAMAVKKIVYQNDLTERLKNRRYIVEHDDEDDQVRAWFDERMEQEERQEVENNRRDNRLTDFSENVIISPKKHDWSKDGF